MKRQFLFTIFVLLVIGAYAQSGHARKKFEFIYIDDSHTSSQDGFTDKLVEQLRNNIQDFADTNVAFILFYSDGKSYSTYSNYEDAKKILEKIYIGSTMYPYDQPFEVKTIKQELLTRLDELNGEIEFNFYVSEKFVKMISEKPAYLVNFLPSEISALTKKVNPIYVNINFPLANKLVNVSETQNILSFMQNPAAPKVKYVVNAF
jgi:hypothetical protein